MKALAQATQSPKAAAPTGIPSTSNILFELWERAAPSLDRASLEWFAQSTEQAECLAVSLIEVVEGIACLVSSDSPSAADRTSAGNFQSSDDVPALLYTIANAIDNIRGLILVGDLANDKLR